MLKVELPGAAVEGAIRTLASGESASTRAR